MTGLIVLLALAAAGSGGGELRAVSTVWLAPGERAPTGDGRLAVTFLEVVEDSRCPEGARCVWEGNARVRLALTEEGEEREVELNSTLDPREAPLGDLVLRFADLVPRPRAGEDTDPAAYRLALEVLRGGE